MEEFREELKKYLMNKDYRKCNNILISEIKKKLVDKITSENKEFGYSTLYEMYSFASLNCSKNISALVQEFYYLTKEELSDEDMTSRLMEIYGELN